jgi:methyl-accepting chemotaxis protein
MVTEAKKVTDIASEIAVASQEQSDGINQISKAVSTMDSITQQNAANAEELASASEELAAQAENLKAIVHELAAEIGGISDDHKTVVKKKLREYPAKKQPLMKKDVFDRKTKPILQAKKAEVSSQSVNNLRGNGSQEDKTLPKTPEDIIPLRNDFTEF